MAHDPNAKGPLEIERTKTDFCFMVTIGIYLVLWMGIALFAGVATKFDMSFNFGMGITPNSIFEARHVTFGFSIFTVILSLTYIILLRQFAKALVFTTIFLFCALLFSIVCIFTYCYATYKNYYEFHLTGLIISWIIFASTVTTIIILRNKILSAVEVLRVFSKIVVSFPSSLLFSILPCILYGLVIAFALTTFNCLLTEYSSHNNNYIFFFHLINIFGYCWLILFVTGWSQTVLSGSFSVWYWAINKKYISTYNTILNFVGITCRYHLGTIACGSFITLIRKLSRLFLNTFGRLYILFGCYETLFGKLENLLKYVNHNAYIMTSNHGTNFWISAKEAFNLLMRHILNILVINRVIEAILFLGQLLVIIISVLAAYGYCQWKYTGYIDETPEVILVVIMLGIIITASVFMVLKIAIDSIFLCILEDYEKNDATTERSYFMSSDLKCIFLQNSQNT